MHLFPDTHFFLHFKHAPEIPWSDVTNDPEVHLVVGRAVSKELDKKKYEMRGRSQERARHYVSKLGDIAGKEDSGILREKNPRIVLSIQPNRPRDWSAPADLEPSWGDDVLLADALAFKHAHPDKDVRILTGDPGLKAKTISHGLMVVSLGDKLGWELQDEKTSEQKELEKIRRENEELKRVGPAIECTLEIEGSGAGRIEMTVTRYPPLSDEAVNEILAELTGRHPKATEFPKPFSGGSNITRMPDSDCESESPDWRAPTQTEIDTYYKRYDAWIHDAESLVRSAHERIRAPALFKEFSITLSNTGNNSADGMRLNIESVGDFRLSEVDENDDDVNEVEASPGQEPLPKLGSPPTPPTWTKVLKAVRSANAVRLSGNYHESLASALARGEIPGGISGKLAALMAANTAADMLYLKHLGQTAEILAQHERISGSVASILRAQDHQRPLGTEWPILHGAALHVPLFDPKLHMPKPAPVRDRHTFYRMSRPEFLPGATSGVAYECKEFRHKTNAKVVTLQASINPEEPKVIDGAIRVSLWATNLKKPFEKTYPVRFTVENGDVRSVAVGLLP